MPSLLEGVGRGRMNRTIIGKLRRDCDLLEGIKELAIKEKIQTGVILSAVGALKKRFSGTSKIFHPTSRSKSNTGSILNWSNPWRSSL